MVLTVEEEALVLIVRALRPQEAEKVLAWANQLSDLSRDGLTEWSDAWTDEDCADVVAASSAHFDQHEVDGD